MAHMKDAEDKTYNQGTASRGKDQRQGKQNSITREGKGASPATSGRFQGSSGRSREDEDLENISSQTDSSEGDVDTLRVEEVSGSTEDTIESANYSDTDEDEDEGLGDGNLGRSVRGGLEG
jgi:hypothetical protein